MSYANPDALVDTDWLADHLKDADLRILDASYFLPGVDRDARAEYNAQHIPGAVFFDIEEVCDPDNPLPHMLPTAELFAAEVGKLGVGNGDRVVIYDSQGMSTAPRAWWMFRVFGHDKVAVLNGGFPKWLREGRPVTDQAVQPKQAHFTARLDPRLIRDVDQMLKNQKNRRELVLDARPAGRFQGTAPEPRAGLRSGHMPGSVNLPITNLIDPESKTILPADRLRQVFEKTGVDPEERPVVTTCGSGVAACMVSLGLYLLGHGQVPVYDGSWSEWGARPDTPIER